MSRYSSGGYGWGGFAPYVSVAERQAKAERTASRLAKKLKRALQPVNLAGRTIAKTFWGKAWCDNIESYRDYAYRLERGRSYVRSGSVIDLVIEKGRVSALVCGSGRNPYEVAIDIKTMPRAKWDGLVKRMTGKISSLMALAAGKLPKELLEDFCNAETGLFPKPSEIRFSCSCPDGARCCKHVAAVLYGIGARLDVEAELFFTLRGVDPQSIVSAESVVDTLTADTASELASSDLGDVFGIALEEDAAPLPRRSVPVGAASCRTTETAGDAAPGSQSAPTPPQDFATLFKSVRTRLHLTQSALAARIGTNQATISAIERGGKLLRASKLSEALKDLDQ